MKIRIVEVEYDLSPVEIGEERLEGLDKHTDVPTCGEFTSKVGGLTTHTLHSVSECVCVCVCVCVCE